MVDPIGQSGGTQPAFPPQLSPQEAQKLQEIQFQTQVLGIFVSVTAQNSPIQRQISQIKNGMQAGVSPNQLASSLNSVISQINNLVVPGKATFPPFQFTGEGSQVQAITSHAVTLEKCLNVLAEHGQIGWEPEQKLFGELTNIIQTAGQITPSEAFSRLNGVIASANDLLPSHLQIPPLS